MAILKRRTQGIYTTNWFFGAATFMLAIVFLVGNSPEFWLNVQRRSDLWKAMHSPEERERIARARPIRAAA